MATIYLLIIGGIILTVGDLLFKFWIESDNRALYVVGLFVYVVGLLFLVESFRSENMAVASTIFVIVNVVTLALVGWLYFGERLSILQIFGILCAFLAVFLLEFGKRTV